MYTFWNISQQSEVTKYIKQHELISNTVLNLFKFVLNLKQDL